MLTDGSLNLNFVLVEIEISFENLTDLIGWCRELMEEILHDKSTFIATFSHVVDSLLNIFIHLLYIAGTAINLKEVHSEAELLLGQVTVLKRL